ncbi:MAG: hypothetical protein JSW30_03465 [Dehalococcoidia bacterium]|nr:MAG: hypothetical protein JSW30_03465 [Dehalococcoidia bacterium]
MTDETRMPDTELFRTSDSMMNEGGLESFLHDLETEQVFWNSGVVGVTQFIGFFNTGNNQYAEPGLREACDNMCRAFIEILDFLVCQSQSMDTLEFTADDTKFGLSMCIDADARQSGIEVSKERLHSLAKASREAYAAYRAAVKKTLSL